MKARLFVSLIAATFLALPASAQDAVHAELAALRKMVAEQNAKIDALSAQVARLSVQLENKGFSAPDAPVSAPEPAAQPAEVAVVPRVTAPAPKLHIVVKGDSLEKIAKANGTTVADLLKRNKIADPKKIQIGQQIALP